MRYSGGGRGAWPGMRGESGQLVSGAYRLRWEGAMGAEDQRGGSGGAGPEARGRIGGPGRIGPLGNEKSPGGADLTGD